MRYFPPLSWPPKQWDKPPVDNWTPPEHWEPNRDRLPLAPEGRYLVVSPLGGQSPVSEANTNDEAPAVHQRLAKRMLGTWARATQADANSYYQAAMRAAWTDRAIDYGEDWSPDERDLSTALEQVWVRGYKLVMSSYQMERWLQAHRRLGGQTVQPQEYRLLRNALEHLDEARFTELTASGSTTGKKNPAIDQLPGGELFLGFHGSFIDNAFGILDLKDVTDKAREYARIDEQYDSYEPGSDDWVRLHET